MAALHVAPQPVGVSPARTGTRRTMQASARRSPVISKVVATALSLKYAAAVILSLLQKGEMAVATPLYLVLAKNVIQKPPNATSAQALQISIHSRPRK